MHFLFLRVEFYIGRKIYFDVHFSNHILKLQSFFHRLRVRIDMIMIYSSLQLIIISIGSDKHKYHGVKSGYNPWFFSNYCTHIKNSYSTFDIIRVEKDPHCWCKFHTCHKSNDQKTCDKIFVMVEDLGFCYIVLYHVHWCNLTLFFKSF